MGSVCDLHAFTSIRAEVHEAGFKIADAQVLSKGLEFLMEKAQRKKKALNMVRLCLDISPH